MIQALPEPMALVIKHAVLTGLRPAEAVESIGLLNDISIRSGQQQMYYSPERQTLEHFRFPDMFLQQTKKAFISYITLDNLQPIAKMGGKIPTWNAIRLACSRMKLNRNMSLTRKLFASHLRQEGIQPEGVDLLQGRVSQSILTHHYLVPQSTLKDEVLRALEKLQRLIES